MTIFVFRQKVPSTSTNMFFCFLISCENIGGSMFRWQMKCSSNGNYDDQYDHQHDHKNLYFWYFYPDSRVNHYSGWIRSAFLCRFVSSICQKLISKSVSWPFLFSVKKFRARVQVCFCAFSKHLWWSWWLEMASNDPF